MVDPEKLEALLLEHVARRPLMRVTDYYKLLYQGVFGVGHIMRDNAWRWLTDEAEGLDIDVQPLEPLIEEVSVDGSMIRVNLRPYLRENRPLEDLFDAMKMTALIEGSPGEFFECWNVFLGLVAEESIKVEPSELRTLIKKLGDEGVKPRHHSEEYREAYSPTYRVIRNKTLDLH